MSFVEVTFEVKETSLADRSAWVSSSRQMSAFSTRSNPAAWSGMPTSHRNRLGFLLMISRAYKRRTTVTTPLRVSHAVSKTTKRRYNARPWEPRASRLRPAALTS